MVMKKRAFPAATALLTWALLAGACAGTKVEPDRVETPLFVAEDGSYRIDLPLGWLRDGNSLTRDGEQTITFNSGPVLAGAGAIDASAPDLFLAMRHELEVQPGVTVLDCGPATFDGVPGFRMHFRTAPSEESAGAVPRETLICGAVAGEVLFAFGFEAPVGEAFERDLPVFERMVASFECRLPEAAGP